MNTPDRFTSLFSLAGEHLHDAAAGEVFLAMEGMDAQSVADCWRESFSHPDRESAAIVEHACASRWAGWDLPAMARAVLSECRSARVVEQMAASFLVRLPHAEAWALLVSLPGKTETFRFDYLTALATIEPQQALALLPPLERGHYGDGDRFSVISAAATVLSPESMLAWLKETGTADRDARAAAIALAKKEPAAAMQIALWLADEGKSHEADSTAAAVFREWSQKDPPAAGRALIEWLGGSKTRTPVTSWYTGHAFESPTGYVFQAWASVAPQEAMAAARSLPQDHMRRIALNSVGLGWPVPEEGLPAARELPPSDRLAFLELVSQTLASSNQQLLREELNSLPLPAKAAHAVILRDCWGHLSEKEAKAFEQKVPQFFEDEPCDMRSAVSDIVAALTAPEALGKLLAQIKSAPGSTAS
jgi:hypothetical protein